MKILLIDYDAGTTSLGGDTHAYDMAREWKKNGGKTLIVTADYSYLRQKNPEKPHIGQIDEQEGISFLWIQSPVATDREKKILRGALPFEKGLHRCFPLIADWEPDVVLLSSRHLLGSHGAAKVAKRLRIPLIFDVRRVYPEHLQEVLEYAPSHFLVQVFSQTQKALYRQSRNVLSIYPKLGEHMAVLRSDPQKFVPVTQVLAPSFWKEHPFPQRHIDFVRRYQEKGNFICLAGGEVEKDQELDLLIEAAALEPRDVLFILVGNGMYKPNLKREVKKRALSNVLFLDGVSPQQLIDLYQAADCLYVGLPPYRWHCYGADATRILLAMASGIPVVCAANIPENPVEKAGCGKVTPPKDVQALIQALEQVQSMDGKQRKDMGKRGKDYVNQNASISHQAAAYWVVLQTTVNQQSEDRKQALDRS